jgi:DnaJ domain
MRDYYRILGIRPDATQAEIKDAWNFSVKAFHPDKFAGSSQWQQAIAQERTKAINEAYGVLSDPIKRANYDREYKQETRAKSAAASHSSPPPAQDAATAQPSTPPPTQAPAAGDFATGSNASKFENRTLLLFLWLGAAAMLISAAVARHPYSFYILLRWVCCAVFAYSAFTAHEKNRLLWSWIFGALAVVYNPIVRVHLDRTTWAAANWVTVGAIIAAALVFWQDKSALGAAEKSAERPSGRSKAPRKRPLIVGILGTALGALVVSFVVLGIRQSRDPSSRHDIADSQTTPQPQSPNQAEPEIRKAIPVHPNDPEIRKAIPARETDLQTKRVRRLAEENSAALATGNYARVVDLTYPKIVEMAGGREKAIDAVRRESEDMRARGDTIPIIEVSEPKEIITAGNRQFAIVPMTTRVKIPEGTVHLKGFLIAISSNSGNSWTFIDGTYLTKERLAQLLPDFPVQLPLPPSEQAVFEPK